MGKIRSWSKEHAPALLFGLVVAIMVVSPHIRVWQATGPENFEGIYPSFSDDEVAYQARVKEVLEGDFAISNPYLKEHMDDPFIMPPVAEWFVAALAYIIGTSAAFVTSAGDFFLTLVNFLLVYALLLVVTRNNKTLALLYTTVFFGLSLATFGRPISPQINAIPFFIGLIYIAKLYYHDEEDKKRNNLMAGLFTGITVFLYPYFFTTILAVYGLLMFGRAITERTLRIIKEHVAWYLVTFLPFAALFVFFQVRAAGDVFYSESLIRYGLMHTHLPGSFTNVALGVLTCALVVLAFRFLSRQELLFAASWSLSIIALNWQNVITGKSLQFASHYRPTLVLAVIVVLTVLHVALLRSGAEGRARVMRVGVVFGMCALLLITAVVRKDEYIHMADMPYTKAELEEIQAADEVFDWLNTNTSRDSVVYALGETYSELLPVYTHNKVYFDFYANFYPVSHSEIEERWLIQQLFDPTIGTSTIVNRQREYAGNRFIDTYASGESRKKILSMLTRSAYVPGEMIPEEYVEYMYGRWLDISAQPVTEALQTYNIDYILLGAEYQHFENAKAVLDGMEAFSSVATFDGGVIYEFNRSISR